MAMHVVEGLPHLFNKWLHLRNATALVTEQWWPAAHCYPLSRFETRTAKDEFLHIRTQNMPRRSKSSQSQIQNSPQIPPFIPWGLVNCPEFAAGVGQTSMIRKKGYYLVLSSAWKSATEKVVLNRNGWGIGRHYSTTMLRPRLFCDDQRPRLGGASCYYQLVLAAIGSPQCPQLT